MSKINYIAEIEHRVAGIPCLIGVIDYSEVKGSYNRNADSDMDYYGYTDCEWEILDRKGYRAKWLDKKLSQVEEDQISAAIAKYFDQQAETYDDYDCYDYD